MKRAQTELLGLAVVVLLISVGMLFIVRFSMQTEPSDAKKSFTHSEMASNILSTLLKTNIPDCSKTTVTELFQDCATTPRIDCIGPGGASLDSCAYLEAQLPALFGRTLGSWNKEYEFTAKRSDADVIGPIAEGDCSGEKQSKIFPIPLHPGTLMLRLDICG
ncbi:MAG: hypothetical protein ABH879_04605 [archaeon]